MGHELQFGFRDVQQFLPCHTNKWLISLIEFVGTMASKSCSIFSGSVF